MSSYIRVDTPAKLKQMDRELMKGDTPRFELIAADTETNGLLFYRNVIVGFSISTDSESGYYVPLLDWTPDLKSLKTKTINKEKREVYTDGWFTDVWTGKTYPEDVTPDEYTPPHFIVEFAERWLCSGAGLLLHNSPFDVCMLLYNFGIDISEYIFCDTLLLKHFIDESTKHALKETAELWKRELGFDLQQDAKQEQKELGESVIRNGGTFNQRTKHIWRAAPEPMAKYGAADTYLCYGVFEVGMQKLQEEYTEEQIELFFEKEVMPVCREVVMPMRFGGVYIDVPYFEALDAELTELIEGLEDVTIEAMAENLEGFSIGKSMDEEVSQQAFIKAIIEREGLEMPVLEKKKRDTGEIERKESLSKPAVKKAYQQNPHWLWGYILGEDEIKYPQALQDEIKLEIYRQRIGRRHRFNLRSDQHLRWLFFDKLGHDKRSVPQTDSATPDNPIPSMAAEVLKDNFLKDYEFVKPLMLFRKLADLRSNYVEKAVRLHNKGWLHMEMNQAGTTSGRFSCSGGFNLQTLPQVEELGSCKKCESKSVQPEHYGSFLVDLHCNDCGHVEEDIICYSVIKSGFVAPPGFKIVSADYASLEPRCFAFMSGDANLKKIYWDNLDMYSQVYCVVEDAFDKYSPNPKDDNFLKKQNPALRTMVKPVVLGIPYGARGPQVANLMGFKKTRVNKTTKEVKEYLDVERGHAWREKYLSGFPDLRKYMEECELLACTQGYVETLIGRRRHYQYAPFVHKLLEEHYEICYEDFLDCTRKSLEGTCPDVKDRNGNVLGSLDEDGLEAFAEEFGFTMEELDEKGNWAYVKAVFKNELDNAKNVRIQGLAGHVTNRGMLDTTRYFQENEIEGYVALQIHDEIMCYVREDQAELGRKYLKKGMEENIFAKLIDIPMQADPNICDTLKDAK